MARKRENDQAMTKNNFDLIEAGRDARGRRVVTVIPAVKVLDKLAQESEAFIERRKA